MVRMLHDLSHGGPVRRAGGQVDRQAGPRSGTGADRAVAAATAEKGETRLTDETRDADDVGADVEITPEMIEAGINALLDFGPREDFEATDPALIVREVFCVMRDAEHLTPGPTV